MRQDTIEALRERRNGQSLRQLAAELGIAPGVLSDALNERHEHVSLRAENRLRVALGLPPVGTYTAPFCPSCGGKHYLDDCRGKKGELAIVGPTEKIVDVRLYRVAPRKRRITRWRDLPVHELAAAIRNRKPYPPRK